MNTSTSAKWTGLRLDPLDVLFFRDGRPFGAATRAEGGLPNPQTLAGALRTAMLAKVGKLREFAAGWKAHGNATKAAAELGVDAIVNARFRGPWIALESDGGSVEPLLPLPLDVAPAKDGGYVRAKVLPEGGLPGWTPPKNAPAGLRPLWFDQETSSKESRGWLTTTGLKAYLGGGVPEKADVLRSDDLFCFENRTGIGVDADRLTADEENGAIYSVKLLRLREKLGDRRVCLYAEVLCDGPLQLDGAPVHFGGEGRHVRITELTTSFKWPQAELTGGKALWVLATPGLFGGWKPKLQYGANLHAAAVGSPVAVSGWDVARGGPKPTRFAAPAGSVYMTEGPAGPPACPEDEDNAQGWGFALRGRWSHE
jgi:CRISPR-associated protein Cmr3